MRAGVEGGRSRVKDVHLVASASRLEHAEAFTGSQTRLQTLHVLGAAPQGLKSLAEHEKKKKNRDASEWQRGKGPVAATGSSEGAGTGSGSERS